MPTPQPPTPAQLSWRCCTRKSAGIAQRIEVEPAACQHDQRYRDRRAQKLWCQLAVAPPCAFGVTSTAGSTRLALLLMIAITTPVTVIAPPAIIIDTAILPLSFAE